MAQMTKATQSLAHDSVRVSKHIIKCHLVSLYGSTRWPRHRWPRLYSP